MKELTEEDIKQINEEIKGMSLDAEQGVFKEPFGIPDETKGHVVYSRYVSGGTRGGSYDTTEEDLVEFYEDEPDDHMRVLDIVLERLFPSTSFLQYNKLKALAKNSRENTYEYYGNNTDHYIEWIELKDIYAFLNELQTKRQETKLVELTANEIWFIKLAISFKDTILPLQHGALDDKVFFQDYGISKANVKKQLEDLKNKLS